MCIRFHIGKPEPLREHGAPDITIDNHTNLNPQYKNSPLPLAAVNKTLHDRTVFIANASQ